MPMTRRHFLQQGSAAAVALTTTPSLLADPLGLPIGCQTYPVRDLDQSGFCRDDEEPFRSGLSNH